MTFDVSLSESAGSRSLHRLVRRFSYQVCEILVDDHLGKLNGVQILTMLPGQLLVPCPHAAEALVDRRSQLQPFTHRGSPIVSATKDPLNRGASQRLFVRRQLANAIKHVVLQNDQQWTPLVALGLRIRRWDAHLVERQGQRREPATGDGRKATRRAGWLPFAGPPGWPRNEMDLAARSAEDTRTEPAPHR